ncbi:MAG: hypothetical protein AB1435_02920 [Chloroflexota bacterium]|jgi:hypothetical protein
MLWDEEKGVDFIDAFSAAWLLARGPDSVAAFDRCHVSRFDGGSVIVPGKTPAG